MGDDVHLATRARRLDRRRAVKEQHRSGGADEGAGPTAGGSALEDQHPLAENEAPGIVAHVLASSTAFPSDVEDGM